MPTKQPKPTSSAKFELHARLKKMFDANVGAITQTTLDNILREANSLLDSECKLRNRAFLDKYENADWFEATRALYTITELPGGFKVVSRAPWDGSINEWEYDSKDQAEDQIYKLMKYKIRDRKRGHGDEEKDLERFYATVA